MEQQHPSESVLLRFAQGELDDALFEVVAAHLEHCDQCEAVLRKTGAFRSLASAKQTEQRLADDESPQAESPEDSAATSDLRSSKHDIAERAGSRVGPYKLLQELGHGGMGVVYMAEQEQPVRRKVALKIIKPGMDSSQVIARFEAERQALAMMDHHNIAKVLDARTTDTGRPYFAMELVKGVPITAYCDANKLTPRERLEMFIPVCQAIQHAHQKGIIHRDIKPSNVLVTLYDGKPVPKVIDFGIAKATQQKLTERTMFTGIGQILGTLEYMSPEQAEMNQLDIDTRSDVYSLGVMLYELLTGSTPITKAQLRNVGLEEMLRTIRETEPPKPSTRLSESGEALPSISAVRKIEPAKLSKLVRGDLDWIVMKALDKDRARRYSTPLDLAADIKRFLCGNGVEAAPPSFSYQLRKYVRRNKSFLTIAATIATILLVSTVVSTWLNVHMLYERKEKERVQHEQKIDDVVQDLLNVKSINLLDQIARLSGFGESGQQLLRTTLERTELADNARLNGDLALIAAGDEHRIPSVLQRIFHQDAETLIAIREILPPEAKGLKSWLWDNALSNRIDAGSRIRVLGLLAFYAPEDPRWSSSIPEATEWLLTRDSTEVQSWVQLLRPVAVHFRQDAINAFESKPWDPKGTAAAYVLAELDANNEDRLVSWIRRSAPGQLGAFIRKLQPKHEIRLREELKLGATSKPPLVFKDPTSQTVRAVQDGTGWIGSDSAFVLNSTDNSFELAHANLVASGYHLLDNDRFLDGTTWRHVALWTRQSRESQSVRSLIDKEFRGHNETLSRNGLTPLNVVDVRLDDGSANLIRILDNSGTRYLSLFTRQPATGESLFSSLRSLPWDPNGANSLLFTGDDAISLAAISFDELAEFTVEAWLEDWRGPVCCQGEYSRMRGKEFVSMMIDVGQTIGWRTGQTMSQVVFDEPDLSGKQHVAMEYYQGRLTVYVNGKVVGTDTVTSPPKLETSQFMLGAAQSDRFPRFASGRFYSLRVSNKARYGESFTPQDTLAADINTELLVSVETDTRGATDISLPDGSLLRNSAAMVELNYRDPQAQIIGAALLSTLGYQPVSLAVSSRQPLTYQSTWRPDSDPSRAIQRLVNLSLAMFALGIREPVVELLSTNSAEEVHSLLVHSLGTCIDDPEQIGALLEMGLEPIAVRSVILSIGELSDAIFTGESRNELKSKIQDIYQRHPDAVVHSAAEWLLTLWRETPRQLGAADSVTLGLTRNWHLNKAGMTMARLQTSPELIAGYGHELPLEFEASAHEVTLAQFRKFVPDHAHDRMPENPIDTPVVGVLLSEAARMCNRLSQMENIPMSEWCFRETDSSIFMVHDYEMRKGYRLPTIYEWEYLCNGTTGTDYFFGENSELIDQYAWYAENSGETVQPVGRLKPNQFGLFDMLGNAAEWIAPEAFNFEGELSDFGGRVRMKGGTAVGGLENLQFRKWASSTPTTREWTTGIRIVRTITPPQQRITNLTEVPKSEIAWATSVTIVRPGRFTDESEEPNAVLGPPRTDRFWDSNVKFYYSLGHEGEIVVGYRSIALIDGPGPDLVVIEVGELDPIRVEISPDGDNWTNIGSALASKATFDIGPFAEPGVEYRFIKLIDLNKSKQPVRNAGAGADIDAIGLIHTAKIDSQPDTE